MSSKLEKKKLIGWIISIIVPILVGFAPVTEVFTPSLKLFFMITLFVILIIAFELLPLLVSAVLMPSLYLMSGLVPVETAFGSWTNTTVWIVVGGFIFSNILDECGLLRRIAYFVVRKCGGTYKGAVFGCFFIGLILNIITFCNGWLVASALVYGVCKAMDLKPSKESALLCFAGTIGATGSTIFLYYPAYYSMIETAIRNFIPDYTMTMFDSFIYNGFCLILFIILIFIFMKIYRIKESNLSFGKDLFDKKYKELGEMTTKEKKAIVLIILLLIYLFSTRFTGLPAAYGFMVIPFIMFLPGIELGTQKSIERLNFSTVFFVATCLGIGIVGAEVGVEEFLTSIAVPMLEGKSILTACIAFMIFGMIMNFFMTPMAMLGGLALPFAQIAMSLEMSPIATCMILLLTCEMVFLPYQSAGNLIMYSYGMMSMKDFFIQQAVKSLVMFVGFIAVLYPLWNLFGLM